MDEATLKLVKYLEHFNEWTEDPKRIPGILGEEQIQQLNLNRALQLDKEISFAGLNKLLEQKDPLYHVWLGHRYRYGLIGSRTADYELAARFYTIAAEVGNPEAMYHLALLLKDGKGVAQDVKSAIALFRKAAKQPIIDYGVAESEYMLGLMYLEGTGLDQNPMMAVFWFDVSSEHGFGPGANNLACMYRIGFGVKSDHELAVKYWKFAASLNVTEAMESLAYFFLKDNPTQARKWFQKAVDNGSFRARSMKDQFEEIVEKTEKNNNVDVLVKWEKDNGLSPGDLTYAARAVRMLNHSSSEEAICIEIFNKLSGKLLSHPVVPFGYVPESEVMNYNDLDLSEHIIKGSETANALQKSLDHFKVCMTLLAAGNNEDEAIHNFSECLRIDPQAVQLTEEMWEHLQEMLENRLNTNVNYLRSDFDCDVRVCYSFLRSNSIQETIAFLYKAKKFYPDESWFYKHLSKLLGFADDNLQGLRVIEEALARFPSDYHLMWRKTYHLQGIGDTKPDELIHNLQYFLNFAPVDHCKVPDSLYCIAEQYGNIALQTTKDETVLKKFFHYGLEAEQLQLSCNLPCESDSKLVVQNILLACDVNKSKAKVKEKTENKDAGSQSLSKNTNLILDPFRIRLVREHREDLAKFFQPNLTVDAKIIEKCKKGKLATAPSTGLKLITLSDMALKEKDSFTYEGYILEVVVSEDVKLVPPFIEIIVEDANGDMQRCLICNLIQDDRIQDQLGFGNKLSIANPFIRIAADGKPLIRVDYPELVFVHTERDIKKCRLCGKGNSKTKCASCKRAYYCSRECQTEDWKILCHKLICSPK